jgi:hypothetical protein
LTQATNFFHLTDTPIEFQETFTDAFQMWISSSVHQQAGKESLWRGPTTLLQRQKEIGWSQMFRGFLAQQWKSYLLYCRKYQRGPTCTDIDDADVQPSESTGSKEQWNDTFEITFDDKPNPRICQLFQDPDRFLSKLTRIIWKAMTQLWTNHLCNIHQDSSSDSPDAKQELQTQILALHALKDKTLAAHRDRYFFHDVHQYVHRATNTQMKKYIDRYRPVVLNSIRRAQKVATNTASLPSFPGFTHTIHSSPRRPQSTREELPHRKHTKIRDMITQRITQFFSRKATSSALSPDP